MPLHAINFPAPNQVEFKTINDNPAQLKPDEFEVQTEFSVLSAGTELSILRGTEDWAPLPFIPGYGALGRVTRKGANVNERSVGERVFFYGAHKNHSVLSTDGFCVPVPEGLDPKLAVMARMGQVAFTAVRACRPELGDVVAVQGLGLVGNLAAQLMKLSGCTVIGLDVSERRLATAKACGVDYTVNTKSEDAIAAVSKLTSGARCEFVVEATGVPALAATAAKLARQHGEVVLLGTPRGDFSGDATEMLRKVHIADTHVTFKGGHEWIYPVKPNAFIKHSLQRNVQILFELMKSGQLRVPELITHCVSPKQSPEVYAGLRQRSEEYFGVVFDWAKV